MTATINILMIAALICFLLAAFGLTGKINLVALGLACWVAAIHLVPLIFRVAIVSASLCLLGCANMTPAQQAIANKAVVKLEQAGFTWLDHLLLKIPKAPLPEKEGTAK